MVLDELNGGMLRCAGHRYRPSMGEETVERVEPFPQAALDVIDSVNDSRIHLDLPASDDLHGAWDADPRLVVAVHIGAHRQLRRFLI